MEPLFCNMGFNQIFYIDWVHEQKYMPGPAHPGVVLPQECPEHNLCHSAHHIIL